MEGGRGTDEKGGGKCVGQGGGALAVERPLGMGLFIDTRYSAVSSVESTGFIAALLLTARSNDVYD